MCSHVYPNCALSEFDLFSEIIIHNRFSKQFKAFFLLKYYMYLDVNHPYYKFVDSTEARFYRCMYHESRTNSQQVFTTFLNILLRVYINNIMVIYDELKIYPGIIDEQLYFFSAEGCSVCIQTSDFILFLCKH